MISGLRVSDTTVLQRLCAGDMKLFLRLGALLQSHLAISELALEAAIASPEARKLLTDRRLKELAPSAFAALLADLPNDAGLTMVDETTGAEPGWRVIVLEDELGNPLLAEGAEPEVASAEALGLAANPALGDLVAGLAPALRAPLEGLLQARADDQRAAALEQLRYAMPPLAVVSELMPMLLADAAELVRERAIGLLMAAGAHVAVVDLIRALQRRDDGALARAGEMVAHLSAPQRDLAVSALMASVARGQVSQAIVNLCQHLAGHLATYRGLDRLLELLLPSRLSLIALVRALQEHDPARIASLLHRHLGQGAEQDATIIILLAAPGWSGDDATLDRAIELLLSPSEAPQERMALASAARRLDEARGADRVLAKRLVARAGEVTAARDTSVIWLIAELCRDGAIDAGLADTLAVAVRRWLRDAPGPHLVAILEQQLPAVLPAGDAARSALVEPLVEVVARFRDDRSLDLVGACLAGIGAAATVPMWLLLEEHPHQAVRLLSANLLPVLVEPVGAAAISAAVQRLLAGLQRADQARERGALVTAAARLAASPAADPALSVAVDAATQGLGEWATEALGHLAAGPHCAEPRRAAILDQLLGELAEEPPNVPVESVVDPATQDVTFVLDERLGVHTENVPRVLAALFRIGSSPTLPATSLAHLIARLTAQWRLVSSWRTIWGPGNIQELGRMLGLLAGRREFPDALRVSICEALLPRLSQLGVARSLARAFAVGDGPYLSELAGRATATLVQLAADKYYADDEWPDLVETLVDFLVIPHLGSNGAILRRRLINLIGAYRVHCTSRARAKLRALLPDLDEDQRQRLDWA